MCGITGIINNPSGYNILEMMDSIAHRGPDSKGHFQDDSVALGHLRLAIQDLSPAGFQPMISQDDRYVLILNGEIYNHKEIKKLLIPKYSFKSTGDTETILYGFAEYGVDLFQMLNGIFAFVIYDKKNKEVFIVRDQFGVKPLYYSIVGESLIFSSEIKSLICLYNFDKKLSKKALANYLYFLYSPGEDTPFENCKKLLSGHYIHISLYKFETKIIKYYELPFNGKYSHQSEEQLIDLLDEKLYKAVERQLLSDVPVGFFLSGGLDSSLIVAMAKKIMPNSKLKCYTIDTNISSGTEGFTEDLPYAVKVAQHLDVNLQIVKANIDILRDFDKMVYHLDEPQADAAPLNVMNICEQARKDGIIVLLGGAAGDDLFSGYRRHQAIYIDRRLKFFPEFLKRITFKLVTFLPSKNSTLRRLRKLFSLYSEKDKETQFASMYAWLDKNKVKKIFREKIEFQPQEFLINSLSNIPNESSLLNKLLFWDMKYFLTDHNLNYTDKMSMVYGIEVRVPFLDLELVEFSTSIPPELKMKGMETKYLLKKVAEKYLPHEVIYRPKSGFGAPVRDWIIDNLSPMVEDYLSKENIEKREIFNFEAIQKLIEDNKLGKVDASYSIWCLLAIESWQRQFVDISSKN